MAQTPSAHRGDGLPRPNLAWRAVCTLSRAGSIAVIGLLFLVTALFTAPFGSVSVETTLGLVADSPLLHTLFIVAFLAVGAGVSMLLRAHGVRVRPRVVATCAAIVVCLLSLAWFLGIGEVSPIADTSIMWNLVVNGDAPGSSRYYIRYPFQLPYYLVLRAAFLLGGAEGGIVLLGVLNCLCLGACAYLLVMLAAEFDPAACVPAALALAVFPQVITVSHFIYNNILSFAFASAGMLFGVRAVRRTSGGWVVASVLMFLCACLLKSTAGIPAIAVGMTWVAAALRGGRVRALGRSVPVAVAYGACTLALALAAFGVPSAVTSALAERYGIDTSQRLPTTAWLMMGNHENEVSGVYGTHLYNPGWWDGLQEQGRKHESGEGFSSPESVERYSQELEREVQTFTSDPAYALDFYVRKVVSTWAEPTSYTLVNSATQAYGRASAADAAARGAQDGGTDGATGGDVSANGPLARAFFTVRRWGERLASVMNLSQTLFLGCALAALVAGRRRVPFEFLAPAFATVGLFLFQLVWENKSQYVLQGYLYLVPFAGIVAVLLARALWQRMTHSGALVRVSAMRRSSALGGRALGSPSGARPPSRR